jgi:hypothetical protein
MPPIATFVDTSLPNFGTTVSALVADGWKKVQNTAGSRRTILLKYYEYLVNTNARLAGINPAMLTPAQLAPVWETANRDYAKYEMYVKNTVQMEDVEMGGVGAAAGAPPMPVEEAFASANDVERMQPGYVDIDDLLAGFGRMGLGGGKRHRAKRHHTKKHRHSKRRHTKHRKTRRH